MSTPETPTGRMRLWLSRHKHRIGYIAVGHTAKRIEEYLFDWLIYGLVVAKCTVSYGPAWGSLAAFCIMAPLSALFCFFYIKFYDWAKIDWLGLEALKELKDAEDTGGWFGKMFRNIARLGKVPAFLALSMYGDPFMVTVYFRHGAHAHSGLSRRDWRIFWMSVVFSNAYWTLRWTVIIEIAAYVWAHILGPLFS